MLMDAAILSAETKSQIEKEITGSPIKLFMKGDRVFPQCGFSGQVIQILEHLGVAYETFDILTDDEIRQGLKTYSNWPTFPQLYIQGELFGGCDIITEQYQSGALKTFLETKGLLK